MKQSLHNDGGDDDVPEEEVGRSGSGLAGEDNTEDETGVEDIKGEAQT